MALGALPSRAGPAAPTLSLTLTTSDLARLDAANRTLLAPLAAPSPEAWLCEAGAAVRDLVGGTGVVLQLPTAPAPYFSDDAPEVVRGLLDYLVAFEAEGPRFTDPVVNTFNEVRRRTRVESFSWESSAAMVRDRGLDPLRGPVVAEVLRGHRFPDYVGVISDAVVGESMVWVLHDRPGGFAHGDHAVDLVQALAPAFRSGLDALGRLSAHRHALDAVAEPLAVVDADGRERHRNAALVRLLGADPERVQVEGALGLLAADLRRLAFPRWGEGAAGPARFEREVRTARSRYTLRASVVPAGAFGPGEAAVVSVAADFPPALPPPDALRQRFGLTAREAEVALLLAEGLTNDAVADRLFVAPKTVRRHTEGVLAKLEVAGRAAVLPRLLGQA